LILIITEVKKSLVTVPLRATYRTWYDSRLFSSLLFFHEKVRMGNNALCYLIIRNIQFIYSKYNNSMEEKKGGMHQLIKLGHTEL
jgi:hypothetical protein